MWRTIRPRRVPPILQYVIGILIVFVVSYWLQDYLRRDRSAKKQEGHEYIVDKEEQEVVLFDPTGNSTHYHKRININTASRIINDVKELANTVMNSFNRLVFLPKECIYWNFWNIYMCYFNGFKTFINDVEDSINKIDGIANNIKNVWN